MQQTRVAILAAVLALVSFASTAAAQQLEIHYINVGWGNSILVKGPNGTTVLMDAGNTGKGTAYVVPYLKSIGIQPASGLDYTIASHQHCDHDGGMDEVINAGYNVRGKNYYNGSTYSSPCVTEWNAAAATTTAGAPTVPPVGQQIALGNGATLTVILVDGRVIGGGAVAVSNENDRSIGVLIQYGGFDFIWAGDLGGGTIDEACTGRFTSSQIDVETSMITAISPGGARPMISAGGIDVLHVNHHGSESSTNHNYMNMAAPAVAIIGVGDGESAGWDLPRIDVVEHVLGAQATACVSVLPAFVVQTEEGNPAGSLTSYTGFNVGDIKVTTDGVNGFTLSANGNVHQGVNELGLSGLPRTFALDDVAAPPDMTAPTTSITSPAGGASVSASVTVTATASDNVAVTKVEFFLDGALNSTDTSSPYAWLWDTTASFNGSHSLVTKAYDAAGNVGTSTTVTIAVNNPVGGGDVSNWRVVQATSSYTFTLPAGTTIPANGYVVIARNATKAAFETFWKVTLPVNAIYINAAGAFPVVNGSENYTLYNAAGAIVDGATISMASSAGQSIQRKDPCLAAGVASSWNVVASSAGTPGSGAAAGCGKGVVINEFSDALGTGNYIYEFVELHNDR
jgi:beta-lactamase superfamily II metal-dependent hydrolase